MNTNGTTTPEIIDQAVNLQRLRVNVANVEIRGVTPLIVHRFDEKAKQMMLDAQTGKARVKKAPKDPVADAERALYRLEDGRCGFPAVGFKAAIIGAARQFDGLTMTALKQAIFVEGEGRDQLVPIVGDWRMREDTVRVGQGVADLRYRPEFSPWSATLQIRYLASALTYEAVIALIDAAGWGGVGEWRPSAPKSHTGTYGRFEVVE
jgi:hypothetical protein